ncbi:MAG TPA: ATP-binding protein [Caulobacteraceae bacterium]|jgi:signal transduction histidine kinase|nr:ATP-binding protein [Caulobacteraceae bacterium]
MLSVRTSRLLASTGVRLAFIQAILLITVFVVAGSLTKVSVKLIYRHDLQTRILGEVATLRTVDREKGMPAVVQQVTLAERRPGGLEYRVADKAGRSLAGDLPATGAGPGWTYLDWDDEVVRGRPFQDLYIYTTALPSGAVLTIGQDLSEESNLRHALKRTLLRCGAVGAGLGLVLSYLFAGGALRRVQRVVAAARAVSAGQLQVRAPTRKSLLPDDIDELGGAFNGMLDEISTLMSRVRWVSTDIAHDLRTPLTHVRHKLDRIKHSGDPSVVAAAVEIEADVDELLRTFDAMLRLAEIENDPGAATRSNVDLAELTGRIADAFRPDIEASGRSLEVALQPATVDGEADLITQAISNLVENALRHTPAGARIQLRAETLEAQPSVSVIDDGPGIPRDQHDAVVERFCRLEASRTTPGSGLGLAIVSAIARRHGGALLLTDAHPGLRAALSFPSPAG